MASITHFQKINDTWNGRNELLELSADIGFDTTSSTTNDKAYTHYNKSLDKLNIESGLLPPGLKLSLPGLVIFERPPTTKLIQYVDLSVDSISEHEYDDQEYDLDVYQIPIPWQLYIVRYSTNPDSLYRTLEVNMFFMNTPLNHPETSLYIPYVHNFFTNGLLCSPMFDSSWEINRYPQDLSGVIASAYDWVWNTGFNADLKECIDQTVTQLANSSNEIVKLFRQKWSSGQVHNGLYGGFYEHISQYSIDDIVNLPWANPSYTSYHDSDYRYLYHSGLTDFTPDEESGESTMEQFKEYIGSPSSIKKTYSDIIKSMFFIESTYGSRNYSDIIKSSTNTFQDINHLAYALYSSILANPS